ncbi:hypothetical protein BJ165DRAFT_377907 [Panaeolus papilionaceus]|nr:hypothetical protein BJ165DRAFT_377907 [Panaeolus papilionaceus]
MENPREDIEHVIMQLTSTNSPDLQKAAIEAYMAPHVSFRHPVCCMESSRNSRVELLGVYQWYRVLSPQIKVKVENVVFDRDHHVLYVEIVQWFKLFFLPLRPAPARLLTRIKLQKEAHLYYISEQEDFYHPDDFAALLLPPLAFFVRLFLAFNGLACGFLMIWANLLGYWRTSSLANDPDADPAPSEPDLYRDDD